MTNREITETVLRAVRAYCVECSGGSRRDVETCSRIDCPLYPYRNRSAVAKSTAAAKPAPIQLAGQMHVNDILRSEGGCKLWVY